MEQFKSLKYDNHDKKKNNNKTYFDLAPKSQGSDRGNNLIAIH